MIVGEEKDLGFLFGRWEGDDDVASSNWMVYVFGFRHVSSSGWSTQLVEDCHMA